MLLSKFSMTVLAYFYQIELENERMQSISDFGSRSFRIDPFLRKRFVLEHSKYIEENYVEITIASNMRKEVPKGHSGDNIENSNFTIFQELKNALAGTDADYTKINLNRAIFLLAVPMILELVMESTFAVADIFFIGKIGASAVATVGLTETYLFLLYSIAMGLSVAVTAVVARRIGEKNSENAGIAAVQTFFLSIIVSLPFSIAGIFYSKELLTLI